MSNYLLHTQGNLKLQSDSATLEVDADLSLVGSASAANWRSSLSAQESSSKLTDLAGVSASGSMAYYDGTNYQAVASSSFGRGLLNDADASARQSSLGLVPGTDVQEQSAKLQDIADATPSNGQSLQWDGSNWVAYTPSDNARDAGNGLALNGNDLEIDTTVTVDLDTAQTLTSKTIEAPVLTESYTLENAADSTRFEYVEIAKASTSDATPVDIYSRQMADDTVSLVKVAVSCIDDSGNVNAYEGKAVFARGTGASSTAMKTAGYNGVVLCEGNANLDFEISANTSNGGYDVTVTGDSVDGCEWVAKVCEIIMA